jgi:ElaB/YqjD/DUF883 family membrane-anchored ribosome-binding protein
MADTITDTQRAPHTSEMQALKNDMAALRADLTLAAERARDAAARETAQGARRLGDMASDAIQAVDDYGDMLEGRIREHPFAAVGIALAAGYALALIARR